MDKDQQIQELTDRVSQLEEENHQLQSMLQKVINKYQKLQEKLQKAPKDSENPEGLQKAPKDSENPEKPKTKSRVSTTSSDAPKPAQSSDLEYSLHQNIEFDNLSFVKSVFSSINANFFFQSYGTYFIHEAVKAGAIKVLNFICAQGVDFNLKTLSGESALTLGAEENKHDAMCIVLQHAREKVDLEFQNAGGMTALQIAVKNGNKEIVGLLAAHGANVNATNMLGDSLVKIAQKSGHQEIVMMLINAGASLR